MTRETLTGKTIPGESMAGKPLPGKSWSENVRWIPEDNYHLTLRFIGQTTEQQISEINQQLTTALKDIAAFNITVLQPQAFPTLARPVVIAAPVKKNHHLQALASIIETAVTAAGLTPEKRPYRGHISIARIKKPVPVQDLLTSEPETVEMNLSSIALYKSTTTQEGAHYHKLFEYKLPVQRINKCPEM